MSESFVDLTYRGLALGRRVKLTQVRPSVGYLELPTPMPVGTTIAIVTDDGVTLDASVTQIHEQVAAPSATGPVATPPPQTSAVPARIPGMLVAPALTSDAARAWWQAHTTLPELAPTPAPPVVARGKSTTVRPRAHTIPEPLRGEETTDVGPPPTATVVRGDEETAVAVSPPKPPPAGPLAATQPMHVLVAKPKQGASLEDELAAAAAVVSEPAIQLSGEHRLPDIVDDGKRTVVMDAVDPELLASLGLDDGRGPSATGSAAEGQRGLIDDGKKTQAMEAIPESEIPSADEPPSRPSSPGGSVKRRRKKR